MAHGRLPVPRIELVGWHATNPELQSDKAYDTAYQTIYAALPNCRNCGCL
jgi:hypothetical protein